MEITLQPALDFNYSRRNIDAMPQADRDKRSTKTDPKVKKVISYKNIQKNLDLL